ncbi:hypothetical protein [Stutzerimonas kirkiae]|uniref:hypothetical protein n=1 Tax=Stutzerimonas kirkiae TaxID=2211392 RepID=UPI0010383306|nr:hypothetical protein [Stutzerimonas kirkiae]TBV08456.1 hypothetical protein DNK01_18940 [Stutzerimonas kirkiae]
MKFFVFIFLALSFQWVNASESTVGGIKEAYVASLLHALELQEAAIANAKKDPHGAPVYLYKLGLSQVLMAWEKSEGNPVKKVQIEEQGCSMIRRAAEEGLIVAGVAQLSLCYHSLEEDLTTEKRDAARERLFKSINAGDKWQSYYPMTVHAFQIRCYVADIDRRIATQTYEQILADAYELAYQASANEDESKMYFDKALEANCKSIQQLVTKDN